jgi:pimeloyl-ACP methyl ester carboxylesterase
MPVLSHDGADLFYQVEGTGPPLLLIMGLGYPSDMWWRVLPWLTPHFTTVRFDNRGVGRTGPGAERPYSVERMALDARAVLHAAGFARGTVFGVSMGGTIAQELALTYPEAVDRLLLGCSHPGGADVVVDEEVLALLANRGAMTPQEAAEASIPFVYAPGTPRADIDADLAVRAAHPTDPAGYMAQLTDTIAWRGSLARLPGLAIPTLLVHGDLDRLVPVENSRRMAEVLPSARLEVLAGASHIFMTDQPERTRAVVESFLIQDQ